MRIPRQILIKSGLTFEQASRILKECEEHPTKEIYDFFIMNNLSNDREIWGVYCRVRGIERFKDAELVLNG